MHKASHWLEIVMLRPLTPNSFPPNSLGAFGFLHTSALQNAIKWCCEAQRSLPSSSNWQFEPTGHNVEDI